MEFSDKNVTPREKCMVCMNPSWIKISIIENKEKLDKFICVFHYIEFLEKYLAEELAESIILFDQNSQMLDIPLYEAIERFGGLDEKILLEDYKKYLEEKIESIDSELKHSKDQFFVTLLQNEKQDKILRKLLTQARIKHSEL